MRHGSRARSTRGSTRRAGARPLSATNASARTSTRRPRSACRVGDGVGGLPDQFGLGGHRPPLVRRVEVLRGLDPVAAGRGLRDPEADVAALLGEEHDPREAVALVRPAVVARNDPVSKRDQHLHRDPHHRERHDRPRQSSPVALEGGALGASSARAVDPRRTRASRRLGQSGAKNTVDTAIISHGNTPMGKSRHVTTWNTTIAPHAYGRVRRQHNAGTTSRSNATPAQLRPSATHRSSSQGPTIARSDRRGSQMRSGWPVHEPVGVELRQPREHVHHRDLRAHEPERADGNRSRAAPPRVERPARARRDGEEHDPEQAHEPVVVQVGGHLDQLEPGEAEQEDRRVRFGSDTRPRRTPRPRRSTARST